MNTFHYFAGNVPVIISIPHTGTFIPDAILNRLTPEAKQLADTDWHLEALYSFAHAAGAHVLIATHSRYVIDLNRSPDGESLYPGQFTTGLCPLTQFNGLALYLTGRQPDDKEIQERISTYWRPYHNKLQTLINELSATHKKVIVFDAHSICSELPKLFSGRLPDLNLGTADGHSMQADLAEKLVAVCKKSTYSMVYNGRFKGGYITRHYGNPAQGINAVQLELAQLNYMQENYPFTYAPQKAKLLQAVLSELIRTLIASIE